MGDALSQQLQEGIPTAAPGSLFQDVTSHSAPPQRLKVVNGPVDQTFELEAEAGPTRGQAATWLSEPLLISQLVQILATRPRNALLLSDLGALLPANLRTGVKEKGGLRNWLQKYPVLFSVAGHPGKETVTLLLGTGDDNNQHGVEKSDGTVVQPGAVARVGESVQDEIVSKEDLDNEAAVQLRGLPYRATVADIKAFLGRHAEFLRDESSVQLVLNRDGRPSGFARLQFSSAAAARAVREDCHMKVLTASGGGLATNHTSGAVDAGGERYVEVFLYSERPNKLRFKKTSCGDAGRDAMTAAEEIRATGISKEQVVLELRDHMCTEGKSTLLLSMLGVALSEGARLYLKRHELGLKHFLAQYPDYFVVEGAKGRELVSYLPIVRPQSSAAELAAVPDPSTPRPTLPGLGGDETSAARSAVPTPHSIGQNSRQTSRSGPEKGSIGNLHEKEHALCESPKPNQNAPGLYGPQDTPACLATPSDWGTPRQQWPRSVGKAKEQRAPSAVEVESNFGLGAPLWSGWQQHPLYQAVGFWPYHSDIDREGLPVPSWPTLAECASEEKRLATTSFTHEVPGVSSSTPSGVDEQRSIEDVKAAAIWLRGLPFTATEQDVLAFFAKHDVVETISEGQYAVQFITKANGRPAGQALVQMVSQEGAEIAVHALNGQWIGTRYIEVFLQDAGPGVEYIFGKPVTGCAKSTAVGGALSSPRIGSDGSATACAGAANERAAELPRTPNPNPRQLASNPAFASPDKTLSLQTPESVLLANYSYANSIACVAPHAGVEWEALFNTLTARQAFIRQANAGMGAASAAQGENSHGGSCGGSQTSV